MPANCHPEASRWFLFSFRPITTPNQFIAEMAGFLGSTPVFGCTSAGELAPDGWGDNSVVALGFGAEDFSIVVRPLSDLSNFRVEDGRRIGTELRHESTRCSPQAEGRNSFGLLLIDGLCRREEAVMSAIYASLDNIPVVGGSAGDGLRFEKTWVFLRSSRSCAMSSSHRVIRCPPLSHWINSSIVLPMG